MTGRTLMLLSVRADVTGGLAWRTAVWPGDVLQMDATGKVTRSWGQIKVYGCIPDELL